MGRKTTTAVASTALPIKDQLRETINSMDEKISESEAVKKSNQNDRSQWEDRILYAQDLINGTNDPDALEALHLLKAQAEEYFGLYNDALTEDDDYLDSLREKRDTLKASYETLEMVDRKKELTEHLRGISSERVLKSVEARQRDEAQNRNINQLIHTAQALIELKSPEKS